MDSDLTSGDDPTALHETARFAHVEVPDEIEERLAAAEDVEDDDISG